VAAFSPPVGGPSSGPSKDTLRTPLVRPRSGCALERVRGCAGGAAARPAVRSSGKQQGMCGSRLARRASRRRHCLGVASAQLSLWLAAVCSSAMRRKSGAGRPGALATARAATTMPGTAPPRRPARCGRARPPHQAARRRGARVRRARGRGRRLGRARCGRARAQAARRRATAATTRRARPRGACSRTPAGSAPGAAKEPQRDAPASEGGLAAACERGHLLDFIRDGASMLVRSAVLQARAPWLLLCGPVVPVCMSATDSVQGVTVRASLS